MKNRPDPLSDHLAGGDPLGDIVFDFVTRPVVEPRREPPGWRRFPLRRSELLIAGALFVAAMAARMPFVLRGETMLHSDECIVGLMAQDISEGTRFPIYFYGQRYMGALEAYVIAALRFVIADPIVSLRLGPAIFFAALAALQFLMLTRWFGRGPALAGAAALIAASPMFTQWSISARGGYIEVLLFGTAVWLAYSEWFVAPRAGVTPCRLALFGLLIGVGMWINPAILLFVAPVGLHALLNRPLAALRARAASRTLGKLDAALCSSPLALPAVAAGAALLLTSLRATWIDEGRVRTAVLCGLLPDAAGLPLLMAVVALLGLALQRACGWTAIRRHAQVAAPFVLGLAAGQLPACLYVVSRSAAGAGIEPAVPLGLRPLWTVGDTLVYLLRGLPLLFGADATGFMDLVLVGHDYARRPLPIEAQAALEALNGLVLGAWVTIALVFVIRHRRELGPLLRMQAATHGPAAFLLMAAASMTALYLLGASVADFNSIRYLVPLWAVVPGVVAAACVRHNPGRLRAASEEIQHAWVRSGRVAAGVLLIAYAAGQAAFASQIGAPHPLRGVAAALRTNHVRTCVAELFDAHELSFLTAQRTRVIEFEPFWPRLLHYRAGGPSDPATYLVDTTPRDWTRQWTDAGWPGPPPPETRRTLWPRLQRFVREQPALVVSHLELCAGYELWQLAAPLNSAGTRPHP